MSVKYQITLPEPLAEEMRSAAARLDIDSEQVTVFVDSGYYIAFLVPRDQWFGRAEAIFEPPASRF